MLATTGKPLNKDATEEEKKLLEEEPTIIQPWDPLGTLA